MVADINLPFPEMCLFSISPGTYDSLLLAPATVTLAPGATGLVVVSAPTLAGSTVNWLLGNAVTNCSITSDTASLATVSAEFAEEGSYPLMVIGISNTGVVVQQQITFEVVTPGVAGTAPIVAAPTVPATVAGVAINYQFYAANEPTSWSANGLPGGLTLNAATGSLTGAIYIPGIYQFEVIATNAGGSSAPQPASITITAPANILSGNNGAVAQYLGWLQSDLSKIDLQFDLRGRGVASFYANAAGVIPLMEGDTCNFAILLFTPAQVNDATTIWFTARTDVDTKPVIDMSITGSAALTTVTGGEYYLLTVPLSGSAADPIIDAINNLDDPGLGAPATLTLYCQLAVLRGGNTSRSAPFLISITERISDAGLAPLNQY
jgi:hypothetical protein